MLYTFRCQKANCRQKFDQSMALAIYERFRANSFYEVSCPSCGTKRPLRHFDARSTAVVHRDFGTWDPRTAPTALAGQHYDSKEEKERQVERTLGDNYTFLEPDRDLTAKPKPPPSVVTTIAAKDAAPSTPLRVQDQVLDAYRKTSSPVAVKKMSRDLNLTYNQVYQACVNGGLLKTRPGVFQYVAP